MTRLIHNSQTIQTLALLTCYGFDLKDSTPLTTIEQWLAKYSVQWIRLAVVEALYQGRYKAVSIDHLLKSWTKRGYPNFHFNQDFERLISHKLPKILLQPLSPWGALPSQSVPLELPAPPRPLESMLCKHQQSISVQTEIAQHLADRDSERMSSLQEVTDIEMILPQWKAAKGQYALGDSPKTPLEGETPWLGTRTNPTVSEETPINFAPPIKHPPKFLDRTIHQFSPQPDRSNWVSKFKNALEQEMAATRG